MRRRPRPDVRRLGTPRARPSGSHVQSWPREPPARRAFHEEREGRDARTVAVRGHGRRTGLVLPRGRAEGRSHYQGEYPAPEGDRLGAIYAIVLPSIERIVTIEDPAVVKKILSHLGIATECPRPAPAVAAGDGGVDSTTSGAVESRPSGTQRSRRAGCSSTHLECDGVHSTVTAARKSR